ncbi:polysaccharide biosynthesis tyrosine autokinase [Candidatus Pelagibacter ubique]|nr:polysaccharide biosynthesis tyrosine autokinase [Candidatus Pelagibacter ubique]MDC0520173.1 polysaccharide biosynthesis tyrosine autokinase [Candidatus Pelagibacter ubique]
MFSRIENLFNLFDLGDLSFFLLLAKKNIKNILIATFLVSIIVFFISLNIEKKYLSEATLVIAPDENKIVNIDEAYSIDSMQNRVNNQIAILKSDEVIEYVVSDEQNQLEFKELYSSVEKNIFKRILSKETIIDKDYIKSILSNNFIVKNIPRSDVLLLSFVSNNPKVSQLALKNIIDSYQRYEVDSKIQITNYANIKITERLKELAIQMDIADKKLAKYKKENNLVDTGNVKELIIKEIQSISNNILKSKQEIQKHENDLISVKAANGDVDILLAIKDLNERKEITNIKNNLSANKNNIQSLLLVYTPKHPKVTQANTLNKSLEKQLKNILNEVIQIKVFELSNLNNFINLSKNDLENAKNNLREIEEKEAGMMNFSREVESSRKLYETFLQRVKETNEAQNLQISKLKIIETPSLPDKPFSPKPYKNFITSLIVASLFFYGLIFYREMNSAVIKTPEAIEHLNIPQIGVLPKVINIKKGYHILQNFLEDSESNFSEAIRSSRAIIESKFKKNSSFLVTSSNPSEGKTSYAFNLALSLERTYKVLFVEADIRRPSVLNSFYKFDKEIFGLGEIISSNNSLKDTIFTVPGTKLEIITSGAKRFDMSDIVSREQIKKFFDVLKTQYDYVIIDSPPVQPVSDTLILTQASDYNLFIIRSETSRTLAFMSSIKKIQNVGAKIDGIVINDLDTSKDSYYNYNYNYNYSSNYYNKT